MSKKTIFILLILIILIGFSLRLFHLSQESLWTDEAFTLSIAESPTVQEVIEKTKISEAVPPGYYLFLHYWISSFGNSEFSLRFPSLIFSVLSILLIYFLTTEINFSDGKKSKSIALFSASFLATSMLQVLYSQEVRIYSLFTFLSLVSTYSFCKLYHLYNSTEKKNSFFWSLTYALSLLVSFSVNYLTIFVLIAHIIALCWNWPHGQKLFNPLLRIYLFVFVLSLPLVPIAFFQYQSINTGAGEIFIRLGVPAFLAKLGLFMFALPMLFVICIALITMFRFKHKTDKIIQYFVVHQNFFLVVLFLGGILYLFQTFHSPLKIPIFRVPITHPYFLIRHSLFLFSIFYIFLAFVIDKLHFTRKIIAIFLILIINITALSVYYSAPTKLQWEEAVSFINEHTKEQPLILLDKGGLSNKYLLNYYTKRHGLTPKILELTKVQDRSQLLKISPEKLYPLIDSHKEIWLILANNKETKDYYKTVLDQRFTSAEEARFYGITITKYTKMR